MKVVQIQKAVIKVIHKVILIQKLQKMIMKRIQILIINTQKIKKSQMIKMKKIKKTEDNNDGEETEEEEEDEFEENNKVENEEKEHRNLFKREKICDADTEEEESEKEKEIIPWIILRDNPYKKMCDLFIAFLILYSAIITPYEIFF